MFIQTGWAAVMHMLPRVSFCSALDVARREVSETCCKLRYSGVFRNYKQFTWAVLKRTCRARPFLSLVLRLQTVPGCQAHAAL